MVFHWILSDSKSPQVSRTLLSILAVLNNAVVWMVSTSPPTPKSSSPFSNPLVTVPNPPITIGIIVTCMFHSFFSYLARNWYNCHPMFHSFFSSLVRELKKTVEHAGDNYTNCYRYLSFFFFVIGIYPSFPILSVLSYGLPGQQSRLFCKFFFFFCWLLLRRFPWCNGYRRRKWTRRHEFKSWTRLIAFHIAQMPLGKVWIQLFSLQLWVNSRAD